MTEESDALDLKRGVFKLTSAKKIAASLKRSAEQSSHRKSGAYRSALSMLTFYINRAGRFAENPARTAGARKGGIEASVGRMIFTLAVAPAKAGTTARERERETFTPRGYSP